MRLLVSGQEVLIDDEDYPLISRYSWYVKRGKSEQDVPYVCCEVWHNLKKIKLSLHRLVMGMGQMEIDHINGNPFDNRKENLRYCTPQQQQYNRRRRNRHGYKGVSGRKKLYAKITKAGQTYLRGPFDTAIDAAKAYNEMALELFGPFANLNRL